MLLSLGRSDLLDPHFDSTELARWEAFVLDRATAWDAAVSSAFAAVAVALRTPGRVDGEHLALTCKSLAEWCHTRGAARSAICFAEAAALVTPENARHAYFAGRIHREQGNLRDAEHWLLRARRVAVWTDDREAQVIVLNSLGNLNQQLGRYGEAEELLRRALRTAKRAGVKERLPYIYHDLLVVAVYTGDLVHAREYAREALRAYAPDHPNVPKLAHDVAWLWFQHGSFTAALKLFDALLGHFVEPEDRLRVLGYAARAAAATREDRQFDRYWTEAWLLLGQEVNARLRAAAALELGLAAMDRAAWEEARHALAVAIESSAGCGENETLVKASLAVERIGRPEATGRPITRNSGRAARSDETLAGEIVSALARPGGEPGGSAAGTRIGVTGSP
ncbi:MAG: tetratricopeptide repeat protein [Gemmatimonadetes bacterium]|nr:tetratricopeptide repeat protein [Gemmatimonadota bacterium]